MANNVTDLGKVGITPAGSWNASTTYERLDVVTYEGSSYVSLVDSNINFNPSTTTGKWQLMAQHGEFTEQQLEDFKAEVVAESKEEMDDYTDDKKTELDTYESTKETELNTYATGLKDDFDTNATAKTTAFNENAESKTTAFNNNASTKTETFDTNASTKTTAFNDNATSKTTDFNTNATNKTTDFNDNATAKTTAFDTNVTNKTNAFDDNASDKTDDFNDNATAKTTAFDENAEAKTDEFDEHTAEIQADIEELQKEVSELSENMPWTETEQATEIQVTDAAKYSRNKLELFGNTEQDNTKMTYKCDGTETGDYYLTYDSTDYYFTMPTIAEGDILVFNTTDLKLYLGDTEITTESTGTGTYLTFISSPNQDYPQDIRVVSGVPYIYHTGKNLANFLTGSRNWRTTTTSIIGNRYKIIKPSTDGLSEGPVVKHIPLIAKAGEKLTFSLFYVKGEMSSYENNYSFRNVFRLYYTDGTTTDIEVNFNRLSYKNKSHISSITLAKDVHLCRFLNFIPGKSFYLSVPLEYDIQIQKNGTTDYTDYIEKIYALNLTKNEFNKNNMTIINGYIGDSTMTLKSDYSDRITAVRCKPNTTYIIKKIYETNRFGVATYNEENLPVATTTQTSYPIQNIVKNNESTYLETTTDADSKWLLIYYAQFNDDNTQILRNAAIDTLQVYEKNSGIEMLKIGDSEDKFEFRDGQWVIPNKIKKIDSYNGEEITTDYISTTGGLDVGATVYYVGNEDYVIEDSELINELNELSKLKTNKDVNNIDIINKTYPLDITDDKTLKPYMQLSYMQDLKSKLDNLDSRLSLLE